MRGKLWEAFEGDRQPALLMDEIGKADIEYPNDLLLELDLLATVRVTADRGGMLELSLVPERHNAAKMLLLLGCGRFHG